VRRTWPVWLAFAVCLGVVLVTLAWLSVTVLELDVRSRRRATTDESVRLALWRLDSALTPLVAQESARPYFAYSAFYPAERAYTRMYNRIEFGDVLVPSPLLAQVSPYILVHFQFDEAGQLTSPQVPTGDMRALAEEQFTSAVGIKQAEGRLERLAGLVKVEAFKDLPLERPLPTMSVVAPVPMPDDAQQSAMPQSAEPQQAEQQEQQLAGQQPSKQQRKGGGRPSVPSMTGSLFAKRDVQERAARQRAAEQSIAANSNMGNVRQWSGEVAAGVLRPLWVGDVLLLARRVAVNGREYVQGCWLDWPALQAYLGDEITDLFPQARLVPLPNGGGRSGERALAALPVALEPGPPLANVAIVPSPLRVSLMVAWGCVLLAAIAAAALLLGILALSERRATFVSAVTHELRTPLTTFRLYTEMLAEGLVVGEEKRRSYLDTLQGEAVRLSHLVENVLAYARLERGRGPGRLERVGLAEVVEGVRSRLAERTRRAGLELVVTPPAGDVGKAHVAADASAVEQILFNLVDNACKYAADGEPARVVLALAEDGAWGIVQVRDYGPGLAAGEAARLFRPFHKSARQAANSAPGVGLGLSLSRRLARAMGGDLRPVDVEGRGACFELRLTRG
jgi:signal transduction histidine kinase